MKKTLNVLLLGVLLFAVGCASNQRIPADLSGVTCTAPVYAVSPDYSTLDIAFDINVPANYFERRVTFTVLPSIKYANGDVKKLPAKSVQGTSVVDFNYPVVDWSVEQTIPYTFSLPLEEAFATATLVVDGHMYNCLSKADRAEFIAEFPLNALLKPLCGPGMSALFLNQADANTLVRGKVYFPVNKYQVTKTEAAQPEITKVRNILSRLIQKDGFHINKIEIVGNASPEGMAKINDPLAKNRADHTKAYMEQELKNMGYNQDLSNAWTVSSTQGLGFWNEFYTAIKESDVENKDAIADRFLGMSSDPAEAERQIRNEMNQNKAVRDLMLPALRFASVAVYYDRLALDPAEVVAIPQDAPEILSANEVITYANEQDANTAIQVYENVLIKNPGAWELYINLATLYTEKGDYENAKATLAKAAKVAPNQDYVNVSYAYIALKQGDVETAEKYLNKVNNADADYYKGILAIAAGDNEKAVELLKGRPDANLAVAQLNTGDVKGAQKTLEGLEEDATVLYLKGVCAARLNDKQKAQEYFEAAQKLNPCIANDVRCVVVCK